MPKRKEGNTKGVLYSLVNKGALKAGKVALSIQYNNKEYIPPNLSTAIIDSGGAVHHNSITYYNMRDLVNQYVKCPPSQLHSAVHFDSVSLLSILRAQVRCKHCLFVKVTSSIAKCSTSFCG